MPSNVLFISIKVLVKSENFENHIALDLPQAEVFNMEPPASVTLSDVHKHCILFLFVCFEIRVLL